MTDAITKAANFVASLGISIEIVPGVSGFLPGIRIVDGGLEYDPNVTSSADILHEAGHLAVLPARYRADAQSDIDDMISGMLDHASQHYTIDSPELRAAMQSGECEATAWAFAAGKHLGLSPTETIEPNGYEGDGLGVHRNLELKAYLGINGLIHGGMCQSRREFPTLTRWLQN